jgi:hypothetical protein
MRRHQRRIEISARRNGENGMAKAKANKQHGGIGSRCVKMAAAKSWRLAAIIKRHKAAAKVMLAKMKA